MATFEQSEDSKQTTEHVEGEPPAPQALEQHANEPANEPANPAVALLKSMFPDFDDLVLQTVLESVSGDQDAAIDVLLGMSDPSYVSTHTPVRHYRYPKRALCSQSDRERHILNDSHRWTSMRHSHASCSSRTTVRTPKASSAPGALIGRSAAIVSRSRAKRSLSKDPAVGRTLLRSRRR